MIGTFNITGFCPELSKELTIVITVEERKFLGDKFPQRAKRGFSCPHGSNFGCQTESSVGCPIYNGAFFG